MCSACADMSVEPQWLDTGSDDLLARIESNVLVVSLNRPAQRNALSRAILNGLAVLFRRAAHDPDIRRSEEHTSELQSP